MSGLGARRATPGDAEVIAALLHDFNAEFDTPSPGPPTLAVRLRTLLGGDSTFAVLGGDSAAGRAAGLALVTLRPNVWFDGPVALLDELYVVPQLRGRGIGAAMVDLVASVCRDRAVELIEVNVDEPDVDAIRFYARHGFSTVDPDSQQRALYLSRPLVDESPTGHVSIVS